MLVGAGTGLVRLNEKEVCSVEFGLLFEVVYKWGYKVMNGLGEGAGLGLGLGLGATNGSGAVTSSFRNEGTGTSVGGGFISPPNKAPSFEGFSSICIALGTAISSLPSTIQLNPLLLSRSSPISSLIFDDDPSPPWNNFFDCMVSSLTKAFLTPSTNPFLLNLMWL